MHKTNRIDFSLTGTVRIAACSLVLSLALLSAGCRQVDRPGSAAHPEGACEEALLVTQAWKCLTTARVHP